MPFFDGHLHSTASDGLLDPAAVVGAAAAAGVAALALTDHDTFAGHDAAALFAEGAGIAFVPGVEMSLDLDGREIHVLAYFVTSRATVLAARLDQALRARRDHLTAILARLAELGYPVSEAEVLAEVTPARAGATAPPSIGRPHVARALVRRGDFRTVDEVFARLLASDQPGYVRRALPDAAEMVAVARAAGGVCSVAHPSVNRVSAAELERLRDAGLAAVEVYHPQHDNGEVVFYLRECQRLDLVPTGGSDHHGVNPYPRDGTGLDRKGYDRLVACRPSGRES